MGQESQDDTGVSYMSAQKVLVFSGTSEGNTISRWLKDNGIDVTVSVATEYGSRNTDGDLNVHYGSYGGVEGISKEIREKGYAAPYIASGLPIHLIGLSFDPQTRQLVDAVAEAFK